jgi:Putative ATPase subunit of terminase (gpP-like).
MQEFTNSPWRDRERLCELYWGQGLTQQEIADEFSCDPDTIQKWMSRYGIPTRPSRLNVESAGLSQEQVQEILDDD